MVKLSVGRFPLEMMQMEWVQLLSPHGKVCIIKIIWDRKTRICKGYAFVEITSEEDTRNVIAALDGHPLGDRTFSINFADEKKSETPTMQVTLGTIRTSLQRLLSLG